MTRAAPHSSTNGSHAGNGFTRMAGSGARGAREHARSSTAFGPEGVSRCRVRFELGRTALSRVIADLRPAAKASPELVIDLTPNGTGWDARVLVCDPASDLRLDLSPAANDRAEWQHDAASSLWHIESADLRATLDLSGDAPRVLYAATPRLAEMGLKGGRYEVAGVSVERG